MEKPSRLQFLPAEELSVIHAAFVVATGGRCTDVKSENALVVPTSEINTRLASASLDVHRFWSALFAEVAMGKTARAACGNALLASGCSELLVDQTSAALGSRLDDCRIAIQARFPKLREQLALRASPLKDRWQTYGPGLLIETAKRIWSSSPPPNWWPSEVDCLLVQPMRGGDGGFDSGQQRVWMEAMLTDADPNVGEIYRLVYWVTRVAIGRHLDKTLGTPAASNDATRRSSDASDQMPEDFGSGTHRRSSLPWDLGIVPVVLGAAAELELLRSPQLPINQAISLWRLGDSQVSQTVQTWWDQWENNDTAMPLKLKALDRMLAPLRKRADAPGPIEVDDV